jgi:hypothetical protein
VLLSKSGLFVGHPVTAQWGLAFFFISNDSTPTLQGVVESGPLPAMKDTTPLLVALGATATAAWLFAKRRKRMSQLPTGFGDPAVQKRFIVSHQAFLLEVPELEKTVEKLFAESNIKISEQAGKRGSAPRTNDELVDSTVFALERAAFDDFGDLLVLACNGHGLGATKVLRSIYEQLVTAMYIAKKPAEANIFLDHGEIDSGKIIERFAAVVPDRLSQDVTPEELEEKRKRHAEAKARTNEKRCNKCGLLKEKDAWTRVSADLMAEEVDKELFDAYTACFLIPTKLIHPTATGLNFRVRFTDQGMEYKTLSEPEASAALLRGHWLIIKMLIHLNAHFGLAQAADVENRLDQFHSVWRKELSST